MQLKIKTLAGHTRAWPTSAKPTNLTDQNQNFFVIST